jgi:hypothetical protein
MIHPLFSIYHFSCQHISGLDTIHYYLLPVYYSPFTSLHQSFVPPLFRERITNTCDAAYFIIYSISTPFVPHKSLNKCPLRQLPQSGPKPLVRLSIRLTRFRFFEVIRSINHDSILQEPFVWIGLENPSLSTYMVMERIKSDNSFLEKISNPIPQASLTPH